jgi:aspartate/methionine/tyrosine aminotransferase
MQYTRMPIEVESPEQMGYDSIKNNLTESSYTDAVFQDLDIDLNKLILCYADHRGSSSLRKLVCEDSEILNEEDVLITVGAAGALFIVASSLLEKDDGIVVVRPNYATNIETPKAIGANIRYVDLKFEDGFRVNIDAVKNAMTPSTQYISVTHPHNPTGVCMTIEELNELIILAERSGCYLLVDETYREMSFTDKLPLACELSDKVISVSSVSKSYGLPGIRIGWIMTRNKSLMETFLAAKEQIHICGSVVDEAIAEEYLKSGKKYFKKIQKDINKKFSILKEWIMTNEHLEWVEPQGGVVCFPRIKNPENFNIELFYQTLNNEYSTYVGPGHWFEMPKHYMRIGYGWPSKKELRRGLEAISLCLTAARHA